MKNEINLVPLEDRLIVRIVEQENKIGNFVIPDIAVEESTIGEVLVPNKISYYRDGSSRKPFLKKGCLVRLPKGKVGTSVPEAPKGEKWLCIPEDCIYYVIE